MGVLEGKRIVVTGSGQGLGRAYAMAMAREGAKLVINDFEADAAEQTVADIAAEGGPLSLTSTMSRLSGGEAHHRDVRRSLRRHRHVSE